MAAKANPSSMHHISNTNYVVGMERFLFLAIIMNLVTQFIGFMLYATIFDETISLYDNRRSN